MSHFGTGAVAEAPPPYSQEDADTVRQRVGLAQTYMLSPVKSSGKPGHPFYMNFLQLLRYSETPATPFARVSFKATSPTGLLELNPWNCKNLPMLMTAGLLVHEILHVMLGHVFMDLRVRKQHPRIFAIAVDLVVNQVVSKDGYELPAGRGLLEDEPGTPVEPVTLDSVQAAFGRRPPANESVEAYCKWLLEQTEDLAQQPQPMPCPGCGRSGLAESDAEPGEEPGQAAGEAEADACETCEGQGQLKGRALAEAVIERLYAATFHEDAPVDAESDEALSSEQQELIQRFMAQAVDEAVQNSGGLGALPGHLQKPIAELLKVLEVRIDLTQEVSAFYGGCGTSVPYYRLHRLNRLEQPGLRGRKRGRACGFVLDESGSRSNSEVAQAFGICRRVAVDHGMTVYAQAADYGDLGDFYEVDETFREGTRLGCGGTNMRPSILKFMAENDDRGEYRVGGVIVITDGLLDLSSLVRPEEVNVPLIWLSSRRVMPFKGQRFAGKWFYFDAATSRLEQLFA